MSLSGRRPKQLSLGPLETEIITILWDLESATVKQIHDCILADPDRELASASVTTVLNRLAKKGWVTRTKGEKAFHWRPLLTQAEAHVFQAQAQLKQFLAISNPEIAAAFADSLDVATLDRLEAIAQRIRAARQAREDKCT